FLLLYNSFAVFVSWQLHYTAKNGVVLTNFSVFFLRFSATAPGLRLFYCLEALFATFKLQAHIVCFLFQAGSPGASLQLSSQKKARIPPQQIPVFRYKPFIKVQYHMRIHPSAFI
ncbi:MAG: hypothetical protein IJ157_11185, partial [Clostridia bacterium]|nr:hypothetical protein [Clostridia bacterium]